MAGYRKSASACPATDAMGCAGIRHSKIDRLQFLNTR